VLLADTILRVHHLLLRLANVVQMSLEVSFGSMVA
jgi:hypothetical protein